MSVDEKLSALGIARPDILLPRRDVDLQRWAVIACDQHTSNREYWSALEKRVGEAPSTLRLILPEVYLEERELSQEAGKIGKEAQRYLEEGLLEEYNSTAVLVIRRSTDGSLRPGLLVALDLEEYDYTPGSSSLVRASELTIPARLPPRVEIREASPLELPHILVLIDDRDSSVIEPLAEKLPGRQKALYETELLAGGGSVAGYAVGEENLATEVVPALEALRQRRSSFLYAAGDGNHSLAAAKEVWNRRKRAGAPENHRSRWALVELVNLYTPGLRFEPIHRLVKGKSAEELASVLRGISRGEQILEEAPPDGAGHAGSGHAGSGHAGSGQAGSGQAGSGQAGDEVILHDGSQARRFSLKSEGTLAVAQVDDLLASIEAEEIDYVHGARETVRLAQKEGGGAVLLPPIERELLFATVAERGALPRKAFSLGESEEKRYYMEARRIE